MAKDLDEVKKLEAVRIDQIVLNDPEEMGRQGGAVLLDVRYSVLTGDGTVVASHSYGADVKESEVEVGGTMKKVKACSIVELVKWAEEHAVKDAKRRYGKGK